MYKQRNPFDTVVVGLLATARVVGLVAYSDCDDCYAKSLTIA